MAMLSYINERFSSVLKKLWRHVGGHLNQDLEGPNYDRKMNRKLTFRSHEGPTLELSVTFKSVILPLPSCLTTTF